MNIFGYFPLFQSFTFCKSTSDIKKIQNKMAATQVALLLLSSILYFIQKNPDQLFDRKLGTFWAIFKHRERR